MNDRHTALVPYYMVCDLIRYQDIVAVYALMGDVWFDAALDMMMFDAIINNTDRHAANFSVLRDNDTGTWIGPAPLFDHNLSLFPHDMPSEFAAWKNAPECYSPRNAMVTFSTVMAQICLKRHHDWARRLLDLELENHPIHPVEDERLRAINGFLHAQGKRILAVKAHSSEEVRETFAHQMDLRNSSLFAQPRITITDYEVLRNMPKHTR